MVGVITHQGRKIERSGKTGLPLREEIAKALVCIFRGTEACELAHRPKPPAMHGRVNSAGVWRFARLAKVGIRVPAGEVSGSIEAANRMGRYRREFRLTLRVFLQSRLQRVL